MPRPIIVIPGTPRWKPGPGCNPLVPTSDPACWDVPPPFVFDPLGDLGDFLLLMALAWAASKLYRSR